MAILRKENQDMKVIEHVRARIMKVIERSRNEAILILGIHPRFKVNIVVKFKNAN